MELYIFKSSAIISPYASYILLCRASCERNNSGRFKDGRGGTGPKKGVFIVNFIANKRAASKPSHKA